MFDFNTIIDRKNTTSKKWGFLEKDLIPMSVADMDLKTSPAIIEAINTQIKQGVLGYVMPKEDYYDAVINWMGKHHDLNIEKQWICTAPAIVPALNWIIQSFTEKGDKILIQPPVYHRFKSCIEINEREVVTNPLKFVNERYVMDFEDLENKIDDKVKLMILCSPHNPVGRVWTKEELTKLSDICKRHNILVVADEIHSDLVLRGNKHTSFLNISKDLKDNCILCTAPTKTFNIAGVQVSNVIIPNDDLRNKYLNTVERNGMGDLNIFAIPALIAAYNESENWYEEMLDYIEGNFDFLYEYIEKKLPKLKVTKAEGTYLAWVDFRGLNLQGEKLKEFMVNKARVIFNEGSSFGEEGEGFYRINLACSRHIIKEALDRIYECI